MKKLGKVFSILMIIACVLAILPTKVYAAGSYSASVGTKTITVGKSTSLVITTKKAAGKFTVTSSDSSVAKVSRASTWVDGKMDNAISIKGVKEGTATITITPVNVSDDEYNLITARKTIKVTVKKASTTTTTTTTKKSSDATLKSLKSDFATIALNKSTTKYTVNVDKTVTSLGLVATANSSKAKIKITGDSNFVIGNNTVTVKVTAEDGTVKNYEILVVKSKYGSGPLIDLKVKNYELNKEFDPGELQYSVDVKDVNSVQVQYTKAQENTIVEVVGNENLRAGKNTVKVITITEKGTPVIYTIDVNLTKTALPIQATDDNVMWLIIIIILVALVIIETLYIVIRDRIMSTKTLELQEAAEVIEEINASQKKAANKKDTKKATTKKSGAKADTKQEKKADKKSENKQEKVEKKTDKKATDKKENKTK